jgi:MFS family permease
MFAVAWGVGAGLVGAGAFYQITMAITARVPGVDRTRALSLLTLIGAFCSPIYLPLTAWLVESEGWRFSERVLSGSLTVCVALGTVSARRTARRRGTHPTASARMVVLDAARSADVRRMTAAFMASGAGASALLVYQVPALQAAGMSLGTAALMASLRGWLSIPGRALLAPVIEAVGARRSLAAAYLAVAIGSVGLLGGPHVPVLVGAVCLTGAGLGATSPLQGIRAADVYPRANLGTLLGVQQALVGAGSALGPIGVGSSADATGSYSWAMVAIAAAFLLSAALIYLPSRRPA